MLKNNIKLKRLLTEKKYVWERNFGEPLPTLSDTIELKLKTLSEGKSYPTQYTAEVMLDWFNAMNSVYTGGAEKEVRDAISKCEKIRLELHNKIFGDDSPWTIKRSGKKAKVEWDTRKAEKLGL